MSALHSPYHTHVKRTVSGINAFRSCLILNFLLHSDQTYCRGNSYVQESSYLDEQGGNEKRLYDEHASDTMQVKTTSAESFDQQHADERHNDVDAAETYSRVLSLIKVKASTFEYRRGIVDDLEMGWREQHPTIDHTNVPGISYCERQTRPACAIARKQEYFTSITLACLLVTCRKTLQTYDFEFLTTFVQTLNQIETFASSVFVTIQKCPRRINQTDVSFLFYSTSITQVCQLYCKL